MIYQRALLASFLESREDELKIECALYGSCSLPLSSTFKRNPLSSTFENATKWGDFQKGDVQKGDVQKTLRYDYGMQGSSGARRPALFFVHNGQPHTSDSTFRSIAVCSVHLAFRQEDIRKQQLEHLASLMPGKGYDETRCLYALLGDFNSSVGEAVMATINKASPDHVLALPAGVKTSIAGERYDEVIVHKNTLGRRHAHVYPCRDLLLPQMKAALTKEEQTRYKSVQMGFANIMSDHLLVYVDLGVRKPHRAARAPPPSPEVMRRGRGADKYPRKTPTRQAAMTTIQASVRRASVRRALEGRESSQGGGMGAKGEGVDV